MKVQDWLYGEMLTSVQNGIEVRGNQEAIISKLAALGIGDQLVYHRGYGVGLVHYADHADSDALWRYIEDDLLPAMVTHMEGWHDASYISKRAAP